VSHLVWNSFNNTAEILRVTLGFEILLKPRDEGKRMEGNVKNESGGELVLIVGFQIRERNPPSVPPLKHS